MDVAVGIENIFTKGDSKIITTKEEGTFREIGINTLYSKPKVYKYTTNLLEVTKVKGTLGISFIW